jgi:beta-N-acetylhexosaminidase
MARHTIGLNYNSIGIENIGGADDIDNLTDAQLEANIKLIKYLSKMLPSIKYLIGHLEYQTFENTPLWKELDNNYRTKKVDPGMRFINAIRENIPNLKKEYSE